jgi:hypothetical protein
MFIKYSVSFDCVGWFGDILGKSYSNLGFFSIHFWTLTLYSALLDWTSCGFDHFIALSI